MAPGMHRQGPTEADLEDAASHSGISISAIAWSGNGLRRVPGVRTMPFYSSASAGLPRAETEQGSSPSDHLCSASTANA